MVIKSITPLFVAVFVASCAFPLYASIVPGVSQIAWVGYIDVGLAFVLLLCLVLTWGTKKEREDHRNTRGVKQLIAAYQILGTVILGLEVVYWFSPVSIDWSILLPGMAWRAWLLMLILPRIFLRNPASESTERPDLQTSKGN